MRKRNDALVKEAPSEKDSVKIASTILRWIFLAKKRKKGVGGLCLGCAEDAEDSAGPAEDLLLSGLKPWNRHSMGDSRWLAGSRLLVFRWR